MQSADSIGFQARSVSSHFGAFVFDCFDAEQTGTLEAFVVWHFVSALYGTLCADLEAQHIHAALCALGQLHNGSVFTLRRYHNRAFSLSRGAFALAWELVRVLLRRVNLLSHSEVYCCRCERTLLILRSV